MFQEIRYRVRLIYCKQCSPASRFSTRPVLDDLTKDLALHRAMQIHTLADRKCKEPITVTLDEIYVLGEPNGK